MLVDQFHVHETTWISKEIMLVFSARYLGVWCPVQVQTRREKQDLNAVVAIIKPQLKTKHEPDTKTQKHEHNN